MARPSKFDEVTAQRIVNAVRSGLPRVHAARVARIHPATLFDWLSRGRAGEPGFSEFSERVAEAAAADIAELVGYMREHARASHQACSWLLSRRAPKHFGERKADASVPAVTEAEAEKLIAECAALHGELQLVPR